MNKIIEYKIVDDYLSERGVEHELSTKVNNAIEDGWQPFGSFILINSTFYQPMVKYERKRSGIIKG